VLTKVDLPPNSQHDAELIQGEIKKKWDSLYQHLLSQGPRRALCSAKSEFGIDSVKEELVNLFDDLPMPVPVFNST